MDSGVDEELAMPKVLAQECFVFRKKEQTQWWDLVVLSTSSE